MYLGPLREKKGQSGNLILVNDWLASSAFSKPESTNPRTLGKFPHQAIYHTTQKLQLSMEYPQQNMLDVKIEGRRY